MEKGRIGMVILFGILFAYSIFIYITGGDPGRGLIFGFVFVLLLGNYLANKP